MRLPWLGPLLLGQALAILVAMTAVCSVLLVEKVRARAGLRREGVFVTGGSAHVLPLLLGAGRGGRLPYSATHLCPAIAFSREFPFQCYNQAPITWP